MTAKPSPARKPANLRSRTARLKLPPGSRSYVVLGDGIALGYRRPKTATLPGQWLARRRKPDGTYSLTTIGAADDFDAPDGTDTLDHAQAVARALGRARDPAGTATLTVQAACDAYCKVLEARGGRAAPEARAAFAKHLGDLGKRKVRDVTEDRLAKACATMPRRVRSNLKAALNALPSAARPALAVTRSLNKAAAPEDEERTVGVEDVPDEARVVALVAAAHRLDSSFGLFVEALRVTGCRPAQIAACRVKDLREGILLVPPSRKGRASAPKPWARRPLPPALADALARASHGRAADALLFPRALAVRDNTPKAEGGTGWRIEGEQPWHRVAWARAARAAGITEGLYALRHAAVVRMILRGVPLRLIAAGLDTSAAMLERVYSRWIGAHGDALMRADAEAL